MSEFIALLLQLEFGELTSCNVNGHAQQPHRPVVIVESRMPPCADPAHAEISQQPIFGVKVASSFKRLQHHLTHCFAILGMHSIDEFLKIEPLARVEAQ